MSISDFEIKWIKFTKSLRNIGVLLIFVIIPYLAFVIIPIHFIFVMISLRDLKNLNRELNAGYLYTFYSKYLTASIFKLIGSLLVHVGAALMFFINSSGFSLIYYYSYYGLFSPSIIIFAIGFVMMIIGSGVEIGAWENLKLFIHHHEDLFKGRINVYTKNKVEILRSGALSWALGFLVITIVIGWITQLVGYFALSSEAETLMKSEPIAPTTQRYQPISPPPQEVHSEGVKQFCAMCGASVEKEATFCANCGVKIAN